MSQDVFDIKEVMERVQNDKDLLLELLDIFTKDYLEKVKLLKQAIDGKDIEKVREIAHSLKGASGNISAKQLYQSFVDLENQAKGGDLQAAPERVEKIEKQFIELQSAIENFKKES